MSASIFYLPRVWTGSQITERALPHPIQPLSAHIKLTENCQAKCISCDYWKTRWQDAINKEQAIDVVKKANSTSFRSINLQTNGLLLKKLHKEVNDSPITKVAVSVDGLESR